MKKNPGFDAIVDGAKRTGNATYLRILNDMFDAQLIRGFSRGYFDDENWMVLALSRAYALTNTSKYLYVRTCMLSTFF